MTARLRPLGNSAENIWDLRVLEIPYTQTTMSWGVIIGASAKISRNGVYDRKIGILVTKIEVKDYVGSLSLSDLICEGVISLIP